MYGIINMTSLLFGNLCTSLGAAWYYIQLFVAITFTYKTESKNFSLFLLSLPIRKSIQDLTELSLN